MRLTKLVCVLGLLMGLVPVRGGEDYLKEAQQENSPLIKESSDHRIKITLLYIGPVADKQISQPFVLVYLCEDLRTDEEYARHHYTATPDGHVLDGEYILTTYPPDLKDGSRKMLAKNNPERARSYKAALEGDFKKVYPQITLPTPAHPDRAGIYEYFYKEVATGPFDITLYDSILAYGKSTFHFHDIDTTSFSSN